MKQLLTIVGILLALLLCNPFGADAQVAFDHQCSIGVSGASPKTTGNACTVTGSNKVMIAGAVFSTNMATVGTVSMTFVSVSLTRIGCIDYNGGARSLCLFGLINPTGTGTGDLAVSWTGSHTATTYFGYVNYTGADQTTGWQNYGSDTGTGTSPSSTVTTANNNGVVVLHANNNASSTTINAGSSAWILTSGSSNGAEGYQLSTGSTATVSWTLGSSVDWGNLKVDVCVIGGCAVAASSRNLMLMGVGP